MKYGWIRSFLLGNSSLQQFAILLARVSLGVFFAISGANKLFVPARTHEMFETLAGAGVPLPNLMTYLVSSIEAVAGCLLIIGFLSSLFSVVLIVYMAVALATVRLRSIPTGLSFRNWLDEFLYLPEVLYIIMMIWLICSGPGRFSLDRVVFGRLQRRG